MSSLRTKPYLTARATIKEWAEEDSTMLAILAAHPDATIFGIDDETVVAFETVENASQWHEQMLADYWGVENDAESTV
jgi:hypothetical protein